MSARVLVTGAAGFIGSSLVDRLLSEGNTVVGLDAFTDYYAPEIKRSNLAEALKNPAFSLLEGNLLDLNLEEVLGGVDGVVHLAAQPGVRTSWGENFSRYLDFNVLATQRLLEALPEGGERRFVFASSSSIYGSAGGRAITEDSPKAPRSPYGLSKLAAEELIQTYVREKGINAVSLRYFTVYGPRQRPEMALSQFIASAMSGEPIKVFGDGKQEREMTHVADIVEATVSALEAPPEAAGAYNVGGGSRITVNQMISEVQSSLGSKAKVDYGPPVKGDVRSTWADLEKARGHLGYTPRIEIEEGIGSQISWTLDRARNTRDKRIADLEVG